MRRGQGDGARLSGEIGAPAEPRTISDDLFGGEHGEDYWDGNEGRSGRESALSYGPAYCLLPLLTDPPSLALSYLSALHPSVPPPRPVSISLSDPQAMTLINLAKNPSESTDETCLVNENSDPEACCNLMDRDGFEDLQGAMESLWESYGDKAAASTFAFADDGVTADPSLSQVSLSLSLSPVPARFLHVTYLFTYITPHTSYLSPLMSVTCRAGVSAGVRAAAAQRGLAASTGCRGETTQGSLTASPHPLTAFRPALALARPLK